MSILQKRLSQESDQFIRQSILSEMAQIQEVNRSINN